MIVSVERIETPEGFFDRLFGKAKEYGVKLSLSFSPDELQKIRARNLTKFPIFVLEEKKLGFEVLVRLDGTNEKLEPNMEYKCWRSTPGEISNIIEELKTKTLPQLKAHLDTETTGKESFEL